MNITSDLSNPLKKRKVRAAKTGIAFIRGYPSPIDKREQSGELKAFLPYPKFEKRSLFELHSEKSRRRKK